MTPDGWSALANVVVALSAATGACAAVFGLSTWRSQLKFQTDHELARKMLASAYGFRQSIRDARWPFISSVEQVNSDGKVVTHLDSQEEQHAGIVRAHIKRWEPIAAYENEIRTLLLETDAVWGNEARELWAVPAKLNRELNNAVRFELEASEPRNRESRYYSKPEDQVAARKRIFGRWGDDDEFGQEFDQALKPLEAYLRTKLGRKPK